MYMAGSLLTSWKPLILMWTTLTGKPRFVPVLTWLPCADEQLPLQQQTARTRHRIAIFLYAVYGPWCTRFLLLLCECDCNCQISFF